MKTERLIWKLIKRLVRAERERDAWKKCAEERHTIIVECTQEIANLKEQAAPASLVALTEEEQAGLRRMAENLGAIADTLGRVDAQHPLAPDWANTYKTALLSHQKVLHAVAETRGPQR